MYRARDNLSLEESKYNEIVSLHVGIYRTTCRDSLSLLGIQLEVNLSLNCLPNVL